MQIKYVRAKNFLSIGSEPVEIDFTKLGNIVHVTGRNLDRGEHASNGAGKSSLCDSLVYGLYGKTLKSLNHKTVINNRTKKGLEVEVRWDDYRVVRTRKPDGLRLWKGDEEITLGGIPATQDEIERRIGLTYQAFINVACFGQHNQYAFLSCDAATKRQIVENLLALDQYNEYAQRAKKRRKAIEDAIALLVKEYEIHHRAVETARRRIEQVAAQRVSWRAAREKEIAALEAGLTARRAALAESAGGQSLAAWQAAQAETAGLRVQTDQFRAAADKLAAGLDEVRTRLDADMGRRHALSLRVQTARHAQQEVDRQQWAAEADLSRLAGLGAECPTCRGAVDPANTERVACHHRAEIDRLRAESASHTQAALLLEEELAALDGTITKTTQVQRTAVEKQRAIQVRLKQIADRLAELAAVPEPADADTRAAQAQIEATAALVDAKRREVAAGDPYQEIAAQADADLADAVSRADRSRAGIKSHEADLPYIDFWVKAFGDQGIRKYVIDDTVPVLNTRINYWLQFLIDNQVTLNFNSELEETIESNPPDGDPFVYNALSGGEHNRIDLAISQAFAYLMMLSAGTCPSVVVLDEVATNVDRPGVHCLYSMISELARDRQVVVITHDPDLQAMLQGADRLAVEKRDGFTVLAP
jgi:DNA repair exonuclease SbcCD ATPase subunit